MVRSLYTGVVIAVFLAGSAAARGDDAALVTGVERQPLESQVRRLVQALENLGAPLPADVREKLVAARAAESDREAVAEIQRALDPFCLVEVGINPESRVSARAGAAPRQLAQQGWRAFLVKVHNEAGVTAPLSCTSPNAAPMHETSDGSKDPEETITARDVRDRWLDIAMYNGQPLDERLSGLKLEYRIVELFSRDAGKREANLAFDVGQGTQDLGFRNEVNLLFDCVPSIDVTLEVLDDDGRPTTGQFTFRDEQGRVYPARSRRLAPDFFFQDQVYRANGETVGLPPGKYTATYSRGPEYRVASREIEVPATGGHSERFELERWINLAERGWYSGDHHIHAAGCAHYQAPTKGVEPVDMMRHILGEDLNVGCVLAWGPCWYYQKQFFEGSVHPLSKQQYLMRYDVEVSGFPSSHCGHLVLLRLKEDDYPGTEVIDQWPSWDLPIMQWAKEQGGVVGFAHSGTGLAVPATELPTYDLPAFDGIGANEYIVDVTHGACDFISAVDTPAVWELNVWYHTLNCGYTTRISGETDFPCVYGERVGLGRTYAQLDRPQGDALLDFDAWVEAIKNGRSYASEGLAHLFDFQVNGLGVGEPGADGRASVLHLKSGQPLALRVQAAALLDEKPRQDIRRRKLDDKPYWHVERARVGDSNSVPVELIVNGESVERKEIAADGSVTDVQFDYQPERSCWVAVRIWPAAHTNPVFVEVDGRPIRASKKSAQWCLAAVDRCWKSKRKNIRKRERAAAEEAYEQARKAYRQIAAESFDDGNFGPSTDDEDKDN